MSFTEKNWIFFFFWIPYFPVLLIETETSYVLNVVLPLLCVFYTQLKILELQRKKTILLLSKLCWLFRAILYMWSKETNPKNPSSSSLFQIWKLEIFTLRFCSTLWRSQDIFDNRFDPKNSKCGTHWGDGRCLGNHFLLGPFDRKWEIHDAVQGKPSEIDKQQATKGLTSAAMKFSHSFDKMRRLACEVCEWVGRKQPWGEIPRNPGA